MRSIHVCLIAVVLVLLSYNLYTLESIKGVIGKVVQKSAPEDISWATIALNTHWNDCMVSGTKSNERNTY